MEEETREFLRERSDRIRLLHENQAKELERFDDESVRLGFRFVKTKLSSLLLDLFHLRYSENVAHWRLLNLLVKHMETMTLTV